VSADAAPTADEQTASEPVASATNEAQSESDAQDSDDREADADGSADANAEAGADQAEGAGAEGNAVAADGTPAKRKRRRRRKRKDPTSTGEVAAADAASGSAAEPRPEQSKKKESHAPFAHRFGGPSNKRHAFAVGEVVAGRVLRVEYGVIAVDLFGKAIAFADEYEPREVPIMPEPPPEAAEPAVDAAAAGVSGAEAEAQMASSQASVPAQVATGGEQTEQADTAATTPVELSPAADTSVDVSAHEPPAAGSGITANDIVASEPDQNAAHVVHGAQDAGAGQEASEPAELQTRAQTVIDDGDDADDADDDHEPAASIEAPREKPEPPALGQVFKGRVGAVSESGHIALLNRIIDTKSVRAELGQFREQHKRVHGLVFGYNRGGFDVLVEGLRAFCPASAMSLEDIAEPLEFVGKKLEFLLPASKAGSKDIIVSRRSILERLHRRKTKEFLRGLTPGQRFQGKVTAVRDFGLFVDIGGVEGLVHQSELSYAFGTKPASVAKVGDEIEVQVLRVGGEPRSGQNAGPNAGPSQGQSRDSGKRDRLTRVSLSVKALLPDPWGSHAEQLSEGSVLKGKVVRAAEFGAFVEIVPEVEGLLHITELGRDLKHANQVVKEGDEIYVAIERIDRKARRISLSKLSTAEVAEFEAGGLARDDSTARNLRQGNNVKIKIERIEPRCVFGRVAGTVGKRGRAFIPSSETGTDRGTDLRKRFPIGTEIEAKIIGIDRDGSLKCSVKAMQVDEERQAVKNYRREAAKQGFGTFGDLLRAKLGEAQK
jgi:small subunit ribosomal protein S1